MGNTRAKRNQGTAMSDADYKQALPSGYELDKYRLLSVLGVGGFGVTYLAEHQTLGHRVAIKEYLPNKLAVREAHTVQPKSAAEAEDFRWGLERFGEEARILTRFSHPNLLRVSDYIQANNTAYIVMDYEAGEPLDEILARQHTLTETQLRRVLLPVADGLRQIHEAGYLHRDIKPGNIYVRRSDETPVLIDFGAARQAIGNRSRSGQSVATTGYSPMEQYESEGEQGPWTDIYSLSAVCYKAITGQAPPEATHRQGQLLRDRPDPLTSLTKMEVPGYSPALLAAVDAGLQVVESNRPQSINQWLAMIESEAGPAPPSPDRDDPQTQSRELAATATQQAGDATTPRHGWKKSLLAATAVAALIATVAVAGWLFYDQPPATEQQVPLAAELPIAGGGGAILVVESEPTGAEVLLDEELIGTTPLRRTDLRAGTYQVTIRHPAYETAYPGSETLREGRVLTLDQSLVRGRGDLTVLAEPATAWIELDGTRLADRTPVTLEQLDAGELFLTIGADGYYAERVPVYVPKDDVGIFEHALQAIPLGTLTLQLEPADALVSMPAAAPDYSAGMSLAEGEYLITVERDGFVPTRQTISVRGDTSERVVLARQPQPLTIAVEPAESVIEFIDRDQIYQAGMLLPPGEYPLRISATGFVTAEQTITHGTAPTRTRINLERAPQPFTVAVVPEQAEVEFVDQAISYRPGIELPPGEYQVRVAAAGYVTVETGIVHGIEATAARIELTRELPPPGSRFRDCPQCPEMVALDSGSFAMGCHSGDCNADELPVHNVTITERFALGRHEVTIAEFRAFVDATGHQTTAERTAQGCRTLELLDRQQFDYTAGRSWRSQEYELRDTQPVVCVSWHDAQAYVEWLAQVTGEPYRLPSEAEWEYAARAGTRTRYHFGDDETALCSFANVADQTELPDDFAWGNPASCSDGTVFPADVASYLPNVFDLYDIHGNVWEWLYDCSSDDYRQAPADGSPGLSGDCTRRVMRGGSWASGAVRNRVANRAFSGAADSGSYLGFRVARSLLP